MIEFCEQKSVAQALKMQGTEFLGEQLNVFHSMQNILKPEAKSNEAAQREIEEAMSFVKESQHMITAASLDPIIGLLSSKEKPVVVQQPLPLHTMRRSRSKSRRSSRSPSRSHSRRSRSKKRSKRSRSRSYTRRRRSRSRSKRRSRSRWVHTIKSIFHSVVNQEYSWNLLTYFQIEASKITRSWSRSTKTVQITTPKSITVTGKPKLLISTS